VDILADTLRGIFRKRKERNPAQRAVFGVLFVCLGFGFTFGPLLISFITTPGENMLSEGGGGGGSAIWGMISTLPIGAVIALIGVIQLFPGVISALNATAINEADESEQRIINAHKAIAIAALGPAALFTIFVILCLNGLFSHGVSDDMFGLLALLTVLQVLFGGRAIFIARKTRDSKLTLTIASFVTLILFGYLYLAFSYFPHLFFFIG
jgi:cytochrome bd-type quinol oxidase subunit 2